MVKVVSHSTQHHLKIVFSHHFWILQKPSTFYIRTYVWNQYDKKVMSFSLILRFGVFGIQKVPYNNSTKNDFQTTCESSNLFNQPGGVQKCNKRGGNSDWLKRCSFCKKSLTNLSGVFQSTPYYFMYLDCPLKLILAQTTFIKTENRKQLNIDDDTVGFSRNRDSVPVVHKILLHVEMYQRWLQCIVIYIEVQYIAHKHNSTMVSDDSPKPTDHNMIDLSAIMVQTSSDYACAQDGYFEPPHPTIIDGDMWLANG